MSRRLLLPLLAALALLGAAAPAALAATAPSAAAGPSARIAGGSDGARAAAADDDDAIDDGAACDVEDPACSETDEDPAGEDDVIEPCDDGLGEDQDDGELADDDAEASAAADDGCEEQDTAAEAAPPRVSALRATVAGKGRAARVRVTFRLDRAGAVRLTLERVGTAAGSTRARCASAARRNGGRTDRRARRGCRRASAVRGSVTVDARAGANASELPRRWGGRPLAPGGYRLTATPAAGAAAATTFTLAAAKSSARR